MKIEIAIISVIVIVGIVLLLPQSFSLFPNTSQIFDEIKGDVSNIHNETQEKIEQTIVKPVGKLNSDLLDLKANSIDKINASSVFNPVKTIDTTIAGIFTKP